LCRRRSNFADFGFWIFDFGLAASIRHFVHRKLALILTFSPGEGTAGELFLGIKELWDAVDACEVPYGSAPKTLDRITSLVFHISAIVMAMGLASFVIGRPVRPILLLSPFRGMLAL